MDEIEAKFRISNPEEIRERLRVLGASRKGAFHEKNVLFDSTDMKFRNSDSILRLRDAGRVTITYKGPRDREHEFHKREELTLQVADTESAIDLLSAIGFSPEWSYEKKRETWCLGGLTIEVDELPRMGFFIEIEGEPDGIRESILKLGLDKNNQMDKNYRELWIGYMKHANLDPESDMVFE